MPRPCKRRRICAKPSCGRFGPKDKQGTPPTVVMTLDEFECIRLIDLEGLTQEQCAGRMNVSRATAQSIYGNARVKLATCLVEECDLKIEGGEYILCEGDAACCGRACKRRCHRS